MNCNLVYNSLFTVYNSLFGPNSELLSGLQFTIHSLQFNIRAEGPRQLHTEFGPNIRTTSILAGPLSFMFSHFTIQNFILQFEQRPPPFAVHSINLIIDTTQLFPFEGGPSSVRGSYTPNLVQIFKGLVTLYAFSPFQFTIRHTTAPCRIQPVSDQTW